MILENKIIHWIKGSKTTMVGYYKEKPMFILSREENNNCCIFLSGAGEFRGKKELCIKWANHPKRLKIASKIIKLRRSVSN